jgi:hypothetical protein
LFALLLLTGCARTTFLSTDPRYLGRSPTQPMAFIDRLPPFPYFSIGIIEVTAPAGTDIVEVVRLAIEKGSQVGCDVIVDRAIHPIASEIPKTGPLLAYVGASQPVHTTTTYAPPPNQRQFICGVAYVRTWRPAPASAPAPAPAAPSPPAPNPDAGTPP